MTTAYTSLLGLALPVTGELSGTWGDTVNDYITQYLDASVAGTQTISGSQTAVTLSKTTNASLSQAGSGATGSSQYNVINCTGNPASMLTVTVPAASKTYVVVNATSTNQDVKIVGAGPTTGVTLVAGEKAIIAWNGSDFIKIATSTADGVTTLSFGSTGLTPSTATSGAVTVAGTLVAANGGTGQSTYTTGDLLYATGSTALSKLGIGTNGQILTSTGTAPQWSTLSGVAVTTFSAGTTGFTPSTATSGAVTLAGTLATTNGGTGLTSFTANRVFYSSSTSAIGSSANLTFDGTTLTANALTTTSTVTINGGTANGVAYLDGSKVLTTGSGFTFNGAALGLPSASVSVGLNTSGQFIDVINGDSTNAQRLRLTTSGTDGVIQVTRSAGTVPNLIFRQDASELMRLTSTGLGIGTSSPTQKLHVEGGNARINNGSNTTILFLGGSPSANWEGDIQFVTSNNQINWRLASNRVSSGSFTITPSTAVGGSTFTTPALTIDSASNVGIGTSSPGFALDVATAAARVRVIPSTTTNLALFQATNTGGSGYFGLDSSAGGLTGTQYALSLWHNGNYPIVFGQNNTERGRFSTAGSFLVGTTTNTNTSSIVANGTISETVSSVQYLVASQFDIGTSPNEIPLNQYLGNLAYQNASSIAGRVGLSAGTAALPSIGSSTDAATGEWFPAASTIAWSTAGAEAMRLTSTGSLGIGTSSPNISAGSGKALTISSVFTRSRLEFQNTAGDTAGNVVGTISFFNGSNQVSSITGGSNTGSATAGYLDFNSSGGSMRLDSSGNLGLGVTPSAWITYTAQQIRNASVYGWSGGNSFAALAANTWYGGSPAGYRYISTDFATEYYQFQGAHVWRTAPSGTAGNAISFTQAMTLDASGNLLAGLTSPLYGTTNRVQISANGSATAIISVSHGGLASQSGYMFWDGTNFQLANNSTSGALIFGTNAGTERARITSVGNLSLGGTANRGTTVGTNAIQIFNGTAPAGTLTNGVSLYSASGDLNFMDAAGNGFKVGYRNLPPVGTQTGSYTLAAGDVGKYVQVGSGGSITVPTSVFAEGDAITLYNNTTGNITITCSAVTAYTAGTNTVKTSMTLATRGVATILFYSATACVISGNVS